MAFDREKIILKKWYTIYKDHITLSDYEVGPPRLPPPLSLLPSPFSFETTFASAD